MHLSITARDRILRPARSPYTPIEFDALLVAVWQESPQLRHPRHRMAVVVLGPKFDAMDLEQPGQLVPRDPEPTVDLVDRNRRVVVCRQDLRRPLQQMRLALRANSARQIAGDSLHRLADRQRFPVSVPGIAVGSMVSFVIYRNRRLRRATKTTTAAITVPTVPTLPKTPWKQKGETWD